MQPQPYFFNLLQSIDKEQLRNLYQPYIGHDVTLDITWQIAARLTQRYRQEGYFLSRAYVPAQEVKNGVLRIVGVEGYINDVSLNGEAPVSSLISKAIDAIKAERPARMQTLERQLLLLNDLPGVSFQATLEPGHDKNQASAHLILVAKKTKSTITLTLDNGGSRYIGPYEAEATWSGSLLPLQKTDLSVQTAPFGGQLYAANATQKIMLTTAAAFNLGIGYTTALPGYTLKPQDITSKSINGEMGLSYLLRRQRQGNITLRLTADLLNTNSNILDTTLSRDRIRTATLGMTFDSIDTWLGRNYLDLAVRRGLPIFGSNKAEDIDISRPGAQPAFMKLMATYIRQQSLIKNWGGTLTVTGQKASGSLYSSEEFGYGGMAIGRAYDTSEISGDDGISGSVEIRYQGLPQTSHLTFAPYGFYDIGKVWNQNTGQPAQISGASAGPGIAINHDSGLAANLYMAVPLTKPKDTPLYGGNGKSPRYTFQMSYKF